MTILEACEIIGLCVAIVFAVLFLGDAILNGFSENKLNKADARKSQLRALALFCLAAIEFFIFKGLITFTLFILICLVAMYFLLKSILSPWGKY